MNIFALDENPRTAAGMHCDSHVVKMIVEYAQILSTAHRVLDGERQTFEFTNNRGLKLTRQAFVLHGETAQLANFHVLRGGQKTSTAVEGREKWAVEIGNSLCYNSTHHNHPSTVWARSTTGNYAWLLELFEACLHEYTQRYQKIHKSAALLHFLRRPPQNIAAGQRTQFALAMPDQYKDQNAVLSYRNYYLGEKIGFAKWTTTAVPQWFADRLPKDINVTHFQRTRPVL